VKDILMSRLDVDAEINAHEYVHSQGFGDFGRVLAASRALQVAFEASARLFQLHGRTCRWFSTRQSRTRRLQLITAFGRAERLA